MLSSLKDEKLLDYASKYRQDDSKPIFTSDQQKAIDGIIDFIAKPFSPTDYAVGLVGPGGVGKTFITNYIIKHCRYSESVIACASPTHKACRVFSQAIGYKKVETIQSTFGFRLDLKLEDFNPNNPQFNPLGKPKLENVRLLIIDESSMLPAKLVTYIYKTCKDAKIKLWFIGDSSQLAPVNEKKSIAFSRCGTIYELNQIVRQSEGNPIRELLNLLREDINNKTYNFITYVSQHVGLSNYNAKGEGFTICNQYEFKNIIDRSFANEDYKSNVDMYRIVAYTNPRVSGWNNYVRNSIICDSDKSIITKHDLIMSYETIVDEFLSTIINNSEEYIINDIVDFVDTTYQFKGYLVKFQLVHGGDITKPLFVIDHRDKYTIQRYVQVLTELINSAKAATGGTRVSRWKEYYAFKKKYLIAVNITDSTDTDKILFSRDLDYGFAITSHKAQGSTYDNVFVDGRDMVYFKTGVPYTDYDDMLRRLYVACSRAHKKLIFAWY